MTVTQIHTNPGEDLVEDPVRTPPHADRAEQSVLGACMLTESAFDEAADVGLRGPDFYRPAHESIWDALRSLRQRGEPVDALTVADDLVKRGEIGRVGGHIYLHTLTNSVPAASNAAYYARIVRERAVLRRLVAAGTKVVQLGYATDGGDVDEIVNAASAEIASVVDSVFVPKDESLDDIADRALEMMEQGEAATPTPWERLDDVISGARPGRFYAVGARPGVGKTVLGVQWAVAHARRHRDDGPQVAYFTFEMTAERLYQRAIASASGVSVRTMQAGNLSDREWKSVVDADTDLRGLPLRLIGASGWSPQQIRAKARQLHRRRPVDFIVIDHIGLTRPDRSGGRESRQMELSEAADVFLGMAHELPASVLVMTQLNRGPANRTDQRPIPTDIRDTDRIEQNADVLMLLHRDKDNHPEDLWVAVAKHREGEEQSVKLTFKGSLSRIDDPQWTPHGSVRNP